MDAVNGGAGVVGGAGGSGVGGGVAGSIGTAAAPFRFTCEDGAVLLLRKAKRSDETRLMTWAGFDENNTASQVRYGQALFQWAVVGAEGLVDEEGNPVRFRPVPGPPAIGKVCCEQVYDAVSSADVKGVIMYAKAGPKLSEDQEGN